MLAEPIPAGALGRACASGVCVAKVNVSDTDHQYADIADDDTAALDSGDTGAAQILYADGTTGSTWAIVRLGPPPAEPEEEDPTDASGVTVSSRLDLTASGSGTKLIDTRDWRMQDNLVHMWVFAYIDGYNPTTPEAAFVVGDPMGPLGTSGYGWPSSSSVPFYDLACPFFCGNSVGGDEWRSVFEYNGGGEFLDSMFRFQINKNDGSLRWSWDFVRGVEGDVHLALTAWGGAGIGAGEG